MHSHILTPCGWVPNAIAIVKERATGYHNQTPQKKPIDPPENQGHTKTLVINQHGVEYCEDTVRWVCFCSHVPVLLSPKRQPLTELRSGQQLADLLWSSQQSGLANRGNDCRCRKRRP